MEITRHSPVEESRLYEGDFAGVTEAMNGPGQSRKWRRQRHRKAGNEGIEDKQRNQGNMDSGKKRGRKTELHEDPEHGSPTSPKRPKSSSFLDMLRARLAGGHFRMLNEKLYTCTGKEALDSFKEEPELFDMMSHWPELPVNNIIINWLKSRSPALTVADFGCGDAPLAKSVKNKVLSFDLVSKDPSVIACDMSNTPLESSSVDVAVFCLSLMGTNYSRYLKEAFRVLKPSGWLLIAEVKSRFDPNTGGADPKAFVKAVCDLGFTSVSKDFSKHFKKKEKQDLKKKRAVDWPELKPCVYKLR